VGLYSHAGPIHPTTPAEIGRTAFDGQVPLPQLLEAPAEARGIERRSFCELSNKSLRKRHVCAIAPAGSSFLDSKVPSEILARNGVPRSQRTGSSRDAEGHRRQEFCSETRLHQVLSCNMQLFVAPDYCAQGSAPLVDHDLRFDSVVIEGQLGT
jgi:hypothetical protein